jgi:polyhydroxybutyrate depolymerase
MKFLRRASIALLVWIGACHGDAHPVAPRTGPLAPGDHDRTLEVAGSERSYILHVPPHVRDRKPLPLVIAFHGGGGHAESQQKYSRLDRVGDREGFVTVYPDGSRGIGRRLLTWNAGSCCGPAMRENVDDVGFVRALVDEIARLVPLDRTRVYATGLSNGAMMSHRLAADAPELIAAIAPVGGANDVRPRPGALAVPVMHVHSVDDPRALYGGGLGPPFPLTRQRVMHTPVEELVGRWVAHDACEKDPQVDPARRGAAGSRDDGHSATRMTWRGCRDGSEVVLWKLTGAGHVWPGGERDFLVRLLGPGTSIIDVNEEMWRFFSRFSRRMMPR